MKEKTFTKNYTLFIKGIAILMMLWHHLFTYDFDLTDVTYISAFQLGGLNIEQILGGFGKICIYIYTFLAGYGLYKSYDGTKTIINRIKKTYITYWQALLVSLPISYCLGTVEYGWKNFIFNMLAIRTTYNPTHWFLKMYLILLLLFPIIKIILDKTCNSFSIGVIESCLLWYIIKIIFPELNFDNPLIFISTFYLGSVFAKCNVLDFVVNKKDNIMNNTGNKYSNLIAQILLYLFLIAIIIVRSNFWDMYDFLFTPLLICLFTLIFNEDNKFNILIKKLGKMSTYIWLVHTFFCGIWMKQIVYSFKYPLLIFSFLLLISYTYSLLIKLLFDNLHKVYENILKK